MAENIKDHVINPDIAEARQHFKNAHQTLHQGMEELLPRGFIENRRAARKEFLLGLRKLLDAAIAKTENKG